MPSKIRQWKAAFKYEEYLFILLDFFATLPCNAGLRVAYKCNKILFHNLQINSFMKMILSHPSGGSRIGVGVRVV